MVVWWDAGLRGGEGGGISGWGVLYGGGGGMGEWMD